MNKMWNMYDEKLLVLTSEDGLMMERILLREYEATVRKDMTVARKKAEEEEAERRRVEELRMRGGSFPTATRISTETT